MANLLNMTTTFVFLNQTTKNQVVPLRTFENNALIFNHIQAKK
jgi:hypothetical protein